MPNYDQPYQWPKDGGILTAPVLRDYASWLFPKLKVEWVSPGVEKRPSPASDKEPKRKEKPYEFRKSRGWLSLQRDVRPFAAYIMRQLEKWANRKPYMPPRKEGMAMVSDLKGLAEHVDLLLKMKKNEQSKSVS